MRVLPWLPGALILMTIALAPEPAAAQASWQVTLTPTLNPLPIGFCGAVHLTVLDPVVRPHALSLFANDVRPATIDHALWIHGPIRADEWWLCDADSTWAGDGRGLVRGRVFDRAGRLVAQIAQEGVLQLPPRPV